jgi:hypothetical protein
MGRKIHGLFPNAYAVLSDAVEYGVNHGARRIAEANLSVESHKATEIMQDEVLNSICEYFVIGVEEGEDTFSVSRTEEEP